MAARPYITGRSPTSLAEGKHRWSRPLDPRKTSHGSFHPLKKPYRFGKSSIFPTKRACQGSALARLIYQCGMGRTSLGRRPYITGRSPTSLAAGKHHCPRPSTLSNSSSGDIRGMPKSKKSRLFRVTMAPQRLDPAQVARRQSSKSAARRK